MMIGMGLGMVDRDIEVGKEYKVGTFTLNGVTYDRYVKVVDCGQMPNNARITVPHGISNVIDFLSVKGTANGIEGANHFSFSFPRVFVISNTQYVCDLYIQNDNIIINVPTYDLSAYTGKVILEYYK